MTKQIFKNLQRGQVSRTLIILAVVVLVVAGIAYVLMRFSSPGRLFKPARQGEQGQQEPPKPVYEAQVGEVKFTLEYSADMGDFLKSPVAYQKDLITTERFIKVIVRAQNKGKQDTLPYTWGLGNVIDSEGRNFIAHREAYYFLPQPDPCGALLKPEFVPISCPRIYEVSRASKNLKVEVISRDVNSSRQNKSLIDLNVE